MDYAIGIDIGGRNIKGVAVTPHGRILARAHTPTGDVERVGWRINVRRAVADLESNAGGEARWLGLAAPGLAAPDERNIAFMPGRFPGLEGCVWKTYLRRKSDVPVLNDAHATLLGEIWRGAAKGKRNVALLTLGTGVGGAAVVDGQLLRGHVGRAGHFGHMSLDPDGIPDITNAPGSLEDAIGDATIGRRSNGRFASTHALIAACESRDVDALRIWRESIQALAAGVASIINIVDPEVVVIGGGITQAGARLFRPLRETVGRFEWRPGGHRVKIAPARLGDRAGAFGAAWNAMRHAGVIDHSA